MKILLKTLPMLAAPFLFCSCPEPVEHHTVRVIEYRKPAAKPKPVTDNPRDFVPLQKF